MTVVEHKSLFLLLIDLNEV